MNILFLTYQGDIAGSTYSISYLARGLAEKGHSIYVGCRKESLLFSLLQDTKAKTVAMTFKNKFDRENMRQIRDVVKQYNIELINPQSSIDRYTTAFAKWLYRFDCKVVHTRRQRPSNEGGWLKMKFYQAVTDKIVAVSHQIKKRLASLGISDDHIKVIYNGTPEEKYQLDNIEEKVEVLKKQFDIGDSDLAIGSISRPKKQEQILEALRFISTPLKVILVGVEAEDRYKKIIDSYDASHKIYFAGSIPPSEAIYYYKLFTIKILASTTEGLSQSLLEAMAMGVPVIATAAAGNLDLINDGENGLFFEDADVKELAKKIELLLGDESLRNKLVEKGKTTALEDFNIRNTVNNYEQFFQELINEKS